MVLSFSENHTHSTVVPPSRRLFLCPLEPERTAELCRIIASSDLPIDPRTHAPVWSAAALLPLCLATSTTVNGEKLWPTPPHSPALRSSPIPTPLPNAPAELPEQTRLKMND